MCTIPARAGIQLYNRYTRITVVVTMAEGSAPAGPLAALLQAREKQRIDAQGTHDVMLAKLLELREQCVGWNDEDDKTGICAFVLCLP